MKIALAAVAAALAACGGPVTKGPTAPVVKVEPPPPPPFVVAESDAFGFLVADATHLYWSTSDSIYRRPLGPEGKPERLFAGIDVLALAVGADALVFVDGEYAVRSMPLAGGRQQVLHQLDDMPWALHVAGDTVWVGGDTTLIGLSPSGQRTITLPDSHTAFAASGAKAYVTGWSDLGASLFAIDLAKGQLRELSTDSIYGDTLSMAMRGDELLVVIPDGVVAIDPDSGEPTRTFYGYPQGVAGDAQGYAVTGYGFVVAHAKDQAPRLLAQSTDRESLPAIPAMAVAGDYVYFTVADNESGMTRLEARARKGGAALLRLPMEASLEVLGVGPDGGVFASLTDDNGTSLYQVGTRKAKPVAVTGYVESLTVGDQHLVVYSDGLLFGATRGEPELSELAEPSYGPTTVIHKGKVYWGDGSMIRAAQLPSGRGFDVADTATFDEAWMDLSIGAVAFADDHLFFTVNVGDRHGLAKIAEDRAISWHWTWAGDEWASYLDASVVAIGDQLYVHDESYVYAVGADGTSQRIFSGVPVRDDDSAVSIVRLYVGGEHLLAWVQGDSDELIEIPRDGGQPRVVWTSSPDLASFSQIAVSKDAVFVYLSDLAAIAKIAL